MPHSAAVADLLGRTALFGSLAQSERAEIARQMRAGTFEAGRQIFVRGDTGRDIYLVRRGRVRLSVLAGDGRTLSFKHAVEGDVFGEIAALDGGPRTADAIALTWVEANVLTHEHMQNLIRTHSSVAAAAIKYICERLRETSALAEDVALLRIEVRLARFLQLKVKIANPPADAVEVPVVLGISQHELGLLVGASRQKVNEALKKLENGGAIKRARGQLLCNPTILRRVAEDPPAER
jgi:CRP/FNR family cyclic AMP-dependent transcriptional regulator